MDISLKCNSLDCRAALNHLAVVTTCSHIFCTPCADNLLTKQAASSHHLGSVAPPACPACHTELKNPDDIVKTNLNPTDDYKTSVLSGLSPSIILEIAGRGISFWMYQTTQEIVYQEYLSKTLLEKFNQLSTQFDNVIHEANTEISALQEKLKTLTIENETISRKNHELGEALREKSRKQIETQERYDKLKRKSLVSHVQTAATSSADRALNHALGSFQGPSNGPAGSGGINNAPYQQGQQARNSGAGQLPFTERERLTIPSGMGSIERREGSVSDGNSESGRRVGTSASRSRIPMNGRVGSAGFGAWNTGTPRENVASVMTPINGQSHRQRLGLVDGGNNSMMQGWNAKQTRKGMGGGFQATAGVKRDASQCGVAWAVLN
ncbi:hypothetical protein TWF106_001757 [Orbilia oligospora]|uniref:RING-type domain-containing protein n=1 Tax=Orbilia oligospora TaxID=2813651 RepID=A0A7C8V0A0_ORBOL|nr:hypothetical protein TWF106_001757 [Orbilia oligospora]